MLTTTASNGLLSNDFDVDSAAALIVDPSQTPLLSEGGAKVTVRPDGSFDYEPDGAFDYLPAGAVATDSFQYVVVDDRGAESVATATIQLTGVDDAPVAGTDGIERGFWTISSQKIEVPASEGVLVNDIDPDDDSGTVLEASFDGFSLYGARVIVNADGSFSYDPSVSATLQQFADDGIDVVDSFTYTITEVAAPQGNSQSVDSDRTDPGDALVLAANSQAPQASSEGVVEIVLRSGATGYSFDLVADGYDQIGRGVSINNKGNVAFQATDGDHDNLYIWSEDTGALPLIPESFASGAGDVSQPPRGNAGDIPMASFAEIVQINDQDAVFAQRQMNALGMLGVLPMGIPLIEFVPLLLTYGELWNGGRVLGGDKYGTPRQIANGDLGLAAAGLRWGNPLLLDFQFAALTALIPGAVGFALTAQFTLTPRVWTLNPVWSSVYYTPVNPVWNAFQDPDNFDFDTLNAVSLATSLVPIWVPQIYVSPFTAIYPSSVSVNNAGQSVFVAQTNNSEVAAGLNIVTAGHPGA